MTEKEFENILSKYPELIEDGLVLKGRQVHIMGKFMDLLFDDRLGQIFNVRLQKGINYFKVKLYESYNITGEGI